MIISVTDISDADIITCAAPCVKEESAEGGLQKPFESCSNNLCFVIRDHFWKTGGNNLAGYSGDLQNTLLEYLFLKKSVKDGSISSLIS